MLPQLLGCGSILFIFLWGNVIYKETVFFEIKRCLSGYSIADLQGFSYL